MIESETVNQHLSVSANSKISDYCQAQPKPQLQSQLGAEVVIFTASPGRQAGRPFRIVLSNHNTALIPKVKLFNLISRTHKQNVTLALSAKRLFNPLLPIFDAVTKYTPITIVIV